MDFIIAILFNISVTSGIVLDDFTNEQDYLHTAYAISDFYFTPEGTPYTFFVGGEVNADFTPSFDGFDLTNKKQYARAGVIIEDRDLTFTAIGKMDRDENTQLELQMNIDTRK